MSHTLEERNAYRGNWYRINYGNGQVSDTLLGRVEAEAAWKETAGHDHRGFYRLQVYVGDGEWGDATGFR